MSVAAMWFILGIILLAVELVSPVFVLFFFGLGARCPRKRSRRGRRCVSWGISPMTN